jgi:hypothetical protein
MMSLFIFKWIYCFWIKLSYETLNRKIDKFKMILVKGKRVFGSYYIFIVRNFIRYSQNNYLQEKEI